MAQLLRCSLHFSYQVIAVRYLCRTGWMVFFLPLQRKKQLSQICVRKLYHRIGGPRHNVKPRAQEKESNLRKTKLFLAAR
jgi:hypothetical protein